jgi:uncharacterized repeat protein (TIGR03803 family)
MNCTRQQDKLFRMIATCVAAMVVLVLTVAAVPAQAQTFTLIDNFLVGGPGPQWPGGPLVQGRDGQLYGWSYAGGTSNTGSIWKTDTSGTVSVILSFATGTGNDCQSGLTLGTDGNFYGTALTNCAGAGYVFKLTPSGIFTVLHTFTGTPDGYSPGPLTQYTDGNFYGITTMGGVNNAGSVFKITPTGTLTVIYSFSGVNNFSAPTYGLTVGNDGNLYGTQVGSDGYGSIYKITPAGTLTVLHTFTGNPDGKGPRSGLILGKDGNFYGVTQYGGINFDGEFEDEGTFFKMTPSGTVTILHNFGEPADYAVYPEEPLVQATDGNFYGAINGCAEFGCTGGPQDIYKLTPSGTLTVVEEFTTSNGIGSYWPLAQDTNGTLFGITQQGGTVNGGVFFSVNISAAQFASLVSTSGKEGGKIGILGQGFSAASVVKFGGVQATSITRSGTTFISATVPAAALSGSVTVTTGATTLTSSQMFKVKPTLLSFSPPSGPVGTSVTITGTGLTQTTKVTFNGTSATFTVNSDTQVTTTVPTGATTGKIAVTTKGGTVKSATSFTVN